MRIDLVGSSMVRLCLLVFLWLVLCDAGSGGRVRHRLRAASRQLDSVPEEDQGQTIDRFPVHSPAALKSESLVAFLSITSSPHHAHLRQAIRQSWILPCKLSTRCDYRFFIDTVARIPHPTETKYHFHHTNASEISKEDTESSSWNATHTAMSELHRLLPDLLLENQTYGDIIFRDECPLMKRHPLTVNYGNAPPLKENLHYSLSTGQELRNEDYPLRRLYKIDWKICFLQVIHQKLFDLHNIFTHVFVEDDSFVCTENLLHQLLATEARSAELNGTSFRTGTPMFDGFDDSSTIMHRDVALLFATRYPSDRFNCSKVADSVDPKLLDSALWLSWGNSWMSRYCDWSREIASQFSLPVSRPGVHCGAGKAGHWEIEFPCLTRPLVLHHGQAAHIMLHEETTARLWHMCEHMLLIDKIKDPSQMRELWLRGSQANHFHDFSDVFVSTPTNQIDGWARVMERLRNESHQCEEERSRIRAQDGRLHWWDNSTRVHSDFPCLFEYFEESMRRRARRLGTARQIHWSSAQANGQELSRFLEQIADESEDVRLAREFYGNLSSNATIPI